MANSIALMKQYIDLLDETYKRSSLTGVLDGAADVAQAGARANEIVIPKLTLTGLKDYSRADGYRSGDVSLTYETVTCNYDRGTKFNIDAMDNEETAGVAYGCLAGEFIRTMVAPELDAFRLSTYASADGISTRTGALTTGSGVIAALRAACNAFDEAEVPETDRYLFITPSLISLVEDLDTTASRAVLTRFASIVRVPQARMKTKITLYDGVTAGQTAGGYAPAGDAKDINFLLIHKPAVIQFQKHVEPKIIPPEMNQNADAWSYGYRTVGIADTYANKLAGIYCHTAA